MDDIQNDTSGVTYLRSVDEFDKTTIQEQRIPLGFNKDNRIPKSIYEKILPIGYQRP